MGGIYSYTDKKDNSIVYIGRDNDIRNKARHYQHYAPSRYDEQVINRVLQNNPDRYVYDVLCEGNCDDDFLNMIERGYIKEYDPKFNFTKGGEGASGYKHSEESRRKMSLAKIGNKCHLGKKHSLETRRKLSESHKGNKLSKEQKDKIRVALIRNYARIVKDGFCNNKQMYVLKKDDNRLKSSNNITKLVSWFNENYPNEDLMMNGVVINE